MADSLMFGFLPVTRKKGVVDVGASFKENVGFASQVSMTGGISSAPGMVWNALGTTGKIAVGAGAGLLAGSFFDIFGSKKAPQTASFAPQAAGQNPIITHAPYENYAPKTDIRNVYNQDYSQIENIVSNSPFGSASSKKSAAVDVSGNTPGTWNLPNTYAAPQDIGQTATQKQGGTDWATLAAIAGVALVAYGYTSRKGK